MNLERLYEYLELGTNDSDISNLLNAINDWPIEVNSVNEYINSIKFFLNVERIDNYQDINILIKNINCEKNVWECESLSEFMYFLESINYQLDSYLLNIEKLLG